MFTRRRKEAYEALHPETRRESTLRRGDVLPFRQVGEAERFTADTAKATGQSEPTGHRHHFWHRSVDDALARTYADCRAVVAKIDLPGMNGIVPNYSDDIEGHLHLGIQSFPNKGSCIVVNVLSLLP